MQDIIFIGILGILTYTDIKSRRLPNWLLLMAIIVKLISFLFTEGFTLIGFLGLLGNGLAVSLPLWLLTMFMDKCWKKKTMGGGDIKLTFVTGLYLGWENNLLMLLIAGVLALLYGVISKEREIPFGPAMAVSTTLIIILEIFI